MKISNQARVLLKSQLQEWELAEKNYKGLEGVRTKAIQLPGGSKVEVQYNPERMRSSAAKVDAKSIQSRPCFLCNKNRPAEQRGILYDEKYTILVNPFPIFPEHFTIPCIEHTDQLISGHFEAMLNLAMKLDEFTLFYNGPKCGASVPDHFHFQAGNKGFMPIEADYRKGDFVQLLGEKNGVQVLNWNNYHRAIITLDSISVIGVAEIFNQIYELLAADHHNASEPMMNILAYSEDGRLIVHIFPRILHRPDCYFAEGDKQLLLSPASVDLGGVFITPREEDFNKISKNEIVAILQQVCLDEKSTQKIIGTILNKYIWTTQ